MNPDPLDVARDAAVDAMIARAEDAAQPPPDFGTDPLNQSLRARDGDLPSVAGRMSMTHESLLKEAFRLLNARILDVEWVIARDKWLAAARQVLNPFHFFLNGKRFDSAGQIFGVLVRCKLPPECASYSITLKGAYPNPRYLKDTDAVENGSEWEATPPAGFVVGAR